MEGCCGGAGAYAKTSGQESDCGFEELKEAEGGGTEAGGAGQGLDFLGLRRPRERAWILCERSSSCRRVNRDADSFGYE